MKLLTTSIFLLAFFISSNSQTVFTLIPANVGDDMHFASDGNIYSSHYGGVYFRKINPVTGEVDTILTASTPTIGAIEMDENLNIYTCSYDLGWVGKFTVGDNIITNITSGLSGPAGITHDNDGNLYVATNQNHKIIKILPDGTKEIFVEGSPLFWPTGITIDLVGNLYVANMFSGQIIKVTPDKQMTVLATLPAVSDQTPDVAYLIWKNNKLYICHFDKHVIYEMNAETGDYFILAGSGQPGNTDGPALQAKFHNPTGIVASPSGDTLYITDGVSPNQRLRMLVLESMTSGTVSDLDFFVFNELFPNPVDDKLTFEFTLSKSKSASFNISDSNGKTNIFQSKKMYLSGKNSLEFDVSKLSPGICFLILESGNFTQAFKFIKK